MPHIVQKSPKELQDISLLRLPQVLNLLPVGRSSFWKGIKEGRYPKGIKLGPRTTVWRYEDISTLLKNLNNLEVEK